MKIGKHKSSDKVNILQYETIDEPVTLVLCAESAEIVRNALFNESAKYENHSTEYAVLMSVYCQIDLDLARKQMSKDKYPKT